MSSQAVLLGLDVGYARCSCRRGRLPVRPWMKSRTAPGTGRIPFGSAMSTGNSASSRRPRRHASMGLGR